MENDQNQSARTLVLDATPENVQVIAIVQRVGSHTGLLVKLAFFYPAKGLQRSGSARAPFHQS